jgi:hypothetical protein
MHGPDERVPTGVRTTTSQRIPHVSCTMAWTGSGGLQGEYMIGPF